ncbi:energy-coupling factor transporter ATP-binding protein EcfA2 [Clostridia bacterium]|nr:energy-coupling factor transporter ATP-binding protein EcfA2 [Clostridia bacterium]
MLLGGEDINADKSKLRAVRQRVGLVFQYPEHQLFEVSVYKEVAFGLKLMETPHMEADSRIRDALSAVGLSEDYYEKSPFELSGGEMRRVAIAGVLAMNPSVLILDEPTAGLDPRGRDKILSQIKYMRELLGITVILVSHSMEDIAKLAERIIVMHNGKIALNGTVSEVFSQADKLAECNLTVPQSTILMKELSANGWDISTDVYTTSAARDTITAAVKGDEK